MMDEITVISYIEQTANASPEFIAPVSGGATNVIKCKARISGQSFMAKICPGNPRRELWYAELAKHADTRMANPKMHKLFPDGNLCLLSPWIDGENLEKRLPSATKEQIGRYAVQAADILLQLHKTPVDYPAFGGNLANHLKSICAKVEEYGLTFPGKDAACQFLLHAADTHSADRICFVHKDIRPENFVVQNEKLYLIDFENGSLGEREADFPYLTTMVRPDHHVWAKHLIEYYISEAGNTDFWENNLLYSTLQVADYAIWKWETKKRQVAIQAENLLNQYDGFTKRIPKWWSEEEGI